MSETNEIMPHNIEVEIDYGEGELTVQMVAIPNCGELMYFPKGRAFDDHQWLKVIDKLWVFNGDTLDFDKLRIVVKSIH